MTAPRIPQICVPILAASAHEAENQILQATALKADLLELRVDYLSGALPSDLKKLLAAAKLPVIVTPRAESEGGVWRIKEHEQLAWAESAIEFGAAYVDLELATDASYLKSIIHFQAQTQIILSFHDLAATPPITELKAKLAAMINLDNHPIIAKFATMANSPADNEVMRALIVYAHSLEQPLLAMTMGEYARESRVEFPLLGSLWGYAALDEEHLSAPGQLTIKALREIYTTRTL